MSNNEIIITIPIDQLASLIIDRLKELKEFPAENLNKCEEFKTRKQISELFHISLPTLHGYTKKGLIQGYRIGSRVLYKVSEIELAIQKIKYGRM